MKVIIDTNVFISGIFFPGASSKVLEGWKGGKIDLILSPEILGEYREVAHRLSVKFKGVDIESIIELVAINSTLIAAPPLKEPVCRDINDDMFIACALAGDVKIIVSGDKDLHDISGFCGIEVVKPRAYVEEYLEKKG